jgi:hypothetical protein
MAPCTAPAGALELHILPTPPTNDFREDSMGIAILRPDPGDHAALFVSRVRETAARNPGLADVKDIMGAVMAHEIGHLLLHSNSHSSSGVMSADFRQTDLIRTSQRQLIFAPEERDTILAASDAKAKEADDGARHPVITIRVADFSRLPQGTLAKAEKYADEVFERTGVSIRWMACPAGVADVAARNPCLEDPRPDEFWLLIEMQKPPGRSRDMMAYVGFEDETNGTSRRAGVFFPAVQSTASRFHAEVYQVLGAAVTHELGHLLLGADWHSRRGVMRPNWGREQIELVTIGELLFTSDQAVRIRAEVVRRSKDSEAAAAPVSGARSAGH